MRGAVKGRLRELSDDDVPLCRARDFYRVQATQLAVVVALLTIEVAAILVASSSIAAVAALPLFEAGCVGAGVPLGRRQVERRWSAAAPLSAWDAPCKPPGGLWRTAGLGVASAAAVLMVAMVWGATFSGSFLMGVAIVFGGALGSWRFAAAEEGERREVLLMRFGRGGLRRTSATSLWLRGRIQAEMPS